MKSVDCGAKARSAQSLDGSKVLSSLRETTSETMMYSSLRKEE